MKKYFVYILECSDGTFYIGKTLNLQKRLQEHNGEIPRGAKYTRTRRPVVLKYFEIYSTSGEALKREHILKKLSHVEKKKLVTKHLNINNLQP